LKRGQELVIVERGDPWLQVKVNDTTVGWVHGNYVGSPAEVRSALKTDLTHRSNGKSHLRQRRVQTTPRTTSSKMSIDAMLEGLPDELPLEEMDLLEGQPRFMGAAAKGQVVVEFLGQESDLQRAEMIVSTVGVSEAELRRNADLVRQFVKNAVSQWKRDTDWVVDFLQGLSSKDKGHGGFDTKSKTVRFLFVKPLGAVRVTVEKT